MSKYAAEHAGAYADVEAAGTSMAFIYDSPGTEQSDGSFTGPTRMNVAAVALEVEGGDPKTYEALGLRASESPRLFVVTSTYGEEVPVGARTTFGGKKYTVRDVDAFRPDGAPIFSYVILGR